MNIPIVETSWNYAGHFYGKVKYSNNIIHWALGQAEYSLTTVVNTTYPAVTLLNGPITTLDKVLCQSLDAVEEKVPAINLPPETIYENTKEYVNNIRSNFVRPILKRADSVKQLGTSVLDSKYTVYAADTLDGALTVADKYVDKYLPADKNDSEDPTASNASQTSNKALKTIYHADKLSRKLQRRLTRLTVAEAKALKQHSSEAINVLVYIVELIAYDPKLALLKSQELWQNLSKDEPENQAPPENLEELIVLLTRESARRFVHFVNFTNSVVSHLPEQTRIFTYKFLQVIEDFFKTANLKSLNETVYEEARFKAHRFTILLYQLNLFTTDFLQHIANSLEEKKSINNTPSGSKTQPSTSNKGNSYKRTANGIDNSTT